jgi:hypothetical protein
VNEIIIQDLLFQPEDLSLFPDFILGTMARRGIGAVEASLATGAEDGEASMVAWQYSSRTTQTTDAIVEVRRRQFRAILARFAEICGVDPTHHTLDFSSDGSFVDNS